MNSIAIAAVLIATHDPHALAEFYRRSFEWDPPQPHGPDHVGFMLPHIYLGFERREDGVPEQRGPISLWFNVTDIESTFDRLVGNGARINYAPTLEESPGEILASLYDPDGNAIGLISSV